MENVYRLYDLSTNIVSDCNQNFNSHFWRVVFHKLNTLLSLSTTDHPETNGQTECVNQVLKYMLCAYVSKCQSDWEDYLPILEFFYNSAKHVTIGFTPFMLMYGFQPRSPIIAGLANEKIHQVKDFL